MAQRLAAPWSGVRLVWAAAALLLLATLLASAAVLRASHAAAVARADDMLRQVIAAAEADVNRNLMSVDLAIAALPKVLRATTVGGGFDGEAAHAALAGLQDQQLLMADITLVDGSGSTLTTALPATRRSDLELPRGLLKQLMSQRVPVLVVSEPLIGRASGERSLLLGRALGLPGAPPLAALAEVPSSLLLSVAASSAVGAGLQLALERDDGLVLVTQPPDDRLIGSRLLPAIAAASATGQPEGAHSRSGMGAVRVARRPTLYAGLFISAMIREDVALTDWIEQRRTVAFAVGGVALLLLGGAGGAHWQLRRLVEARRQASEAAELLDEALSSMGDAFLVCDAQDRVVRWNQRYADLFPWLRDVLRVGTPFSMLAEAASHAVTPSGDEVERQAWIARRVALHRSADRPWEQVLGTGIAVHAVERQMPSGGVVSVYRDMSTTERKLAQAKQAAEAASEAKSRFLANMSHEIRTPLNAVLGLNALLLRSNLDAGQRRWVELMRSSGQLLLALINDVLDLSRVDAGRLELHPEVFDPGRLADEVVSMLQERALAQRLELRLELVPGLAGLVRGDAMRVRQVLFNLVGNALKFTERGRVRVALSSRPSEAGVLLQLRVEDTGIGIAAEDLATLFDRFSQADSSASRRHGGTGLGLAITKEVVQRMGGRIEVRSEPGRGSVFTVELPCERVDGPAVAASPGHGGPAPDAPVRRLQIMVVDDNPVNSLVTEAMLRHMGHDATLVDNGRLAVERAADGGWDLVLMDMQMPELDGLAATRAIRALGGEAGAVPIVAVTANARPVDRQACLDAGMNDHLAKPIDFDDLERALGRVRSSGLAARPMGGDATAVSSP